MSAIPPPAEEYDEWDTADADEYYAIGDTGAGAAVGSIEALEGQGGNADQLKKRCRPLASHKHFSTANGTITSEEGIRVKTLGAGDTILHLFKNCPMAISVGEEVAKGHAFIWLPKLKPYFANAKYVRVSCPKTRRYEAAYVTHNVPHFKIGISEDPESGETR